METFACKVASYAYFYKKNVEKCFRNKVAYSLVNIGIVVDAIAFAAKNKILLLFEV